MIHCRTAVTTFMPFLLAILSGCARPEMRAADAHSKPSIWGGQRVEASDPLAGATVALIRSNGYPFCTGSFMGANMVLTAAHCVTNVKFGRSARRRPRRQPRSPAQESGRR